MNKDSLYLVGVFVVLYIVAFFVFSGLGYNYSSPTFWLMPIPIFFLSYYIPDFFDEEKKTILHSWMVVPLFLVFSLVAWWLAASIYFYNLASLQGFTGELPDVWPLMGTSSYLIVVVFGTLALAWRNVKGMVFPKKAHSEHHKVHEKPHHESHELKAD